MDESRMVRSGRVRRRRRRITPRFFWVAPAVLLVAYLCYGYVDGFIKMTQLQHAIRETRKQAEVLETRNRQLQQELARLESDAYIEMVARRELGLVMPGEQAYVVVTEEVPKER